MNPLDQFKNTNASQKAIEAAMGGITKLGWVTELTKSISQTQSITAFNGAFEIIKSMQQNVSGGYIDSIQKSTSGIEPLMAWYKNNPLKNQMDGIIANHAALSKSLTGITAAFPVVDVKPFNAMEVALRGISTDFLKNISFDDYQTAEVEYEAIEEVTEVIASQSEILNESSNNSVTIAVFEKYQNQVLEELQQIRAKTKSEKVKTFITDLMNFIAFAYMIFTLYGDSHKISNREQLEIFKNETIAIQEQTDIKLDSILNKITKQRIAKTDVNLRVKGKKRAAKKGIVKKDNL
jgi:hypothetical protein